MKFIALLAATCSARWPEEPTQAWVNGPRFGGNDKELNEAEARQRDQHNRFGVPNVIGANQ